MELNNKDIDQKKLTVPVCHCYLLFVMCLCSVFGLFDFLKLTGGGSSLLAVTDGLQCSKVVFVQEVVYQEAIQSNSRLQRKSQKVHHLLKLCGRPNQQSVQTRESSLTN